MFYESPDELYNDGNAFKLTFRDSSGLVVTVIADNYFGYCKKEVKTQISFSANLSGLSEEEHAGGAVVFPSYDLGEEFDPQAILPSTPHNFNDTLSTLVSIQIKHLKGHIVTLNFHQSSFFQKTPNSVCASNQFHGLFKMNKEPCL